MPPVTATLLHAMDGCLASASSYSIGYSNVSYFNKLFKEEYGCTPKAFKTLSKQ